LLHSLQHQQRRRTRRSTQAGEKTAHIEAMVKQTQDDDGLPEYLLEEEDEPMPWPVRFFLIAACVLVIEIVVIAVLNVWVVH
jgi:hypothetical protein